MEFNNNNNRIKCEMWGKWEMGEGSLFRNEDCHILFRSSHWRCSVKKMFLEILQNSQENTCTRVSFLMERRLWHRYFSVNFAKFSKNIFFFRTPLVDCFYILRLFWRFLMMRKRIHKNLYVQGCRSPGKPSGAWPPNFLTTKLFYC